MSTIADNDNNNLSVNSELTSELMTEFKAIKNKLEDIEVIFNKLYSSFSTESVRLLSKKDRNKIKNINNMNNYTQSNISHSKYSSLIYGEIEFNAFKEVFDRLYELGLPRTGGVFIDIGCGSGKPV